MISTEQSDFSEIANLRQRLVTTESTVNALRNKNKESIKSLVDHDDLVFHLKLQVNSLKQYNKKLIDESENERMKVENLLVVNRELKSDLVKLKESVQNLKDENEILYHDQMVLERNLVETQEELKSNSINHKDEEFKKKSMLSKNLFCRANRQRSLIKLWKTRLNEVIETLKIVNEEKTALKDEVINLNEQLTEQQRMIEQLCMKELKSSPVRPEYDSLLAQLRDGSSFSVFNGSFASDDFASVDYDMIDLSLSSLKYDVPVLNWITSWCEYLVGDDLIYSKLSSITISLSPNTTKRNIFCYLKLLMIHSPCLTIIQFCEWIRFASIFRILILGWIVILFLFLDNVVRLINT